MSNTFNRVVVPAMAAATAGVLGCGEMDFAKEKAEPQAVEALSEDEKLFEELVDHIIAMRISLELPEGVEVVLDGTRLQGDVGSLEQRAVTSCFMDQADEYYALVVSGETSEAMMDVLGKMAFDSCMTTMTGGKVPLVCDREDGRMVCQAQ